MSAHSLSLPTNARGFSLLEVVLAVAVFALIAAAGYAGLDQLSRAASAQREAAATLEQLHMSMALLEQDVSQTIARPVLDDDGRSLDPFIGERRQLQLTRSGWANPLNQDRSSLKRVEWRYDGDTLQRWLWPVLDRGASEPPELDSELSDVREVSWRYLDSLGQWHDQWPPANQPQESVYLSLPHAVEIVLQRGTDYRVRRLLEMSGE